MVSSITSNANGFKTVSYTISILPLIPAMALEGFSPEGITWEDVSIAEPRLGADGYKTVNQKPVLRTCTFSLLPNSPCRNFLDNAVVLSTPVKGKALVSYEIILVERNELTNYITTYGGGTITGTNGGNNNNMDDGQGNKTYTISFSSVLPVPLA